MSLRKTFLAFYFCRFLEKSILPKIEGIFTDPNQFTLLGLMLAVIVPFGFYAHPAFGLLFIALSGLADVIDGLDAKKRGMNTAYGAFLDSSVDRVSDFSYLIGFWILFWGGKQFILASMLIMLSVLFSLLTSYIKARAENLGSSCDVGLMERGVRIIYLLIWASLLCIVKSFFDVILWAGLVIFCILTLATVLQRTIHIRLNLTRQSD